MKIGNPADKPTVTSPGRAGEGSKTDKSAAPQAAPAEASATVALSSQATQLLANDKAIQGDFDNQKVERIAQAITDGKFEINAPAIADKLLANAREVLGKSQH
jgi:negative regulator of flagellin synthesis FlgM